MARLFVFVFLSLLFCQRSMAQGDHISIGIGPSMVYVDNNSGVYQDLNFKVKPAFTASYNKQMTENIALRGTFGVQFLNSGEYDLSFIKRISNWGKQDQAFDFKGTGYFVDVLPVFTTNPNALGMLMSTLQFYAGIGFGGMFVQREQKTLLNGVVEDGELIEGDFVTTNETSFSPYIPFKTGISTNLSGDWDFGLEFSLFVTMNSELDGNNIKHNQINPDMASQILFKVKRYIGPAW